LGTWSFIKILHSNRETTNLEEGPSFRGWFFGNAFSNFCFSVNRFSDSKF